MASMVNQGDVKSYYQFKTSGNSANARVYAIFNITNAASQSLGEVPMQRSMTVNLESNDRRAMTMIGGTQDKSFEESKMDEKFRNM